MTRKKLHNTTLLIALLSTFACWARENPDLSELSDHSFYLSERELRCTLMADLRKIPDPLFFLSQQEILNPLLSPTEESVFSASEEHGTRAPLYFEACGNILSNLALRLSELFQSGKRTNMRVRESTLYGHLLSWGIGTAVDEKKAYSILYNCSFLTFYPPVLHELAILLLFHGKQLSEIKQTPLDCFLFAAKIGFSSSNHAFHSSHIYLLQSQLLSPELPKDPIELSLFRENQKNTFDFINYSANQSNSEALYSRALLRLSPQSCQFFDTLSQSCGMSAQKFSPSAQKALTEDLTLSAQSGHKIAQFHLASLLYNGKIIPLNIPRALEIFKDLAEEGHHESLHNLIKHHVNNRELHRAREWVQKAIKHAFPVVTVFWFNCLRGLDVLRYIDYIQEAILWLKEQSDKPDASQVKTILGQIYFEGLYQPKDYALAEKYLTEASRDKDNLIALYRLALLHIEYTGDPVTYEPYSCTVKEPFSDNTMANEVSQHGPHKRNDFGMQLLIELSERFHGAKIHLARYLIEGTYCTKNLDKAEKLLNELPSTYTPAIFHHGLIQLERGNIEEAMRIFLSIEDKSSDAAYQLGKIYYEKLAISDARHYLITAVQQGHVGAHLYLVERFGYTSRYPFFSTQDTTWR